jgi:hypothetical protein
MPEESDELESALISAIDFASKYKKGNEKKKSRTEKEQEEKLFAMKKELKKSKQLVVKHVLHARRLEHAVNQVANVNQAITQHVQGMASAHTRRRRVKMAKFLTEPELRCIDIAANLISGSSSALQRSLQLYSDDHLTRELHAFPLEQIGHMSIVLFAKVAWISSGKRISLTEALRIFEYGSTYATIISKNEDTPFDLVRWRVLIKMLRAKLRLAYLASALETHYKEKQSHEMVSSPKKGSNLRSPTHKFVRSGPETFGSTLPALQRQLSDSKKRQANLSKKIKTNMSLVSQTVPLGSLTSAQTYAKRVGAGKVLDVVLIKVRGYYKLTLDKLQQNVAIYRAALLSETFERLLGTWKIFSVFDLAALQKQQRYLRAWVVKLENLHDAERHAAAVELQRVGRGAIDRFNVRNRHRISATRVIQRLVRGLIARKRVRALRDQQRMQWAVRVVELAWQKNKWFRTLRNLMILRKQARAVCFIQRVYRGHRGRIEGRARRLLKRKHYGALKMQCLWRRYETVLLVDQYYRRWKEVEGSIIIQRFERGRQGRLRAKRVRRWLAAVCTIQRATRCRQARDKVYHQRRRISSRNIQRVYRGHKSRLRVAKLLRARRLAKERHDYALQQITRVVRGFYIRRLWGPILEDYKRTRLEAMKKIKARYKAVKAGNADRRMIQKMRAAAAVITRSLRRFKELCSDRLNRDRLMKVSATKIQAAYRGLIGRRYAEKYCEWVRKMRQPKGPIYYRLKRMYYLDQNAFNGWAAIRIQCLMRRVLAKQLVEHMRFVRAAEIVQACARKYLERKEAKKIAAARKYALYYKHRMAIRIQKRHRGILGRKLAFTHRSADLLKWFLRETRIAGLPKRCFINFRFFYVPHLLDF